MSNSSASHKLPDLPFAYDALEPHISRQIMELHHGKHHAAYVTNLNRALDAYAAAALPDRVASLAAINFNAGGHINHSLFWENLAPASSPDAADPSAAAPKLLARIADHWGDLAAFKAAFAAELLAIKGSGWGWLVKDPVTAALSIVTTRDQDTVLGAIPVFGVDMWEHAYYLQYLNGKAAYVDNIWSVINWRTAEARFLASARAQVFKALDVGKL